MNISDDRSELLYNREGWNNVMMGICTQIPIFHYSNLPAGQAGIPLQRVGNSGLRDT